MSEKRVQIGAAIGVVVGLLMVWYLVDLLWVQGWSMHIIHLVAILAAALVTMAASVIVLTIVIRYRRVLESKNRELQRLAAVGEIVAGLTHYQKNLLNGLIGDQILDRTAIYRAILDLVSNAIDACAESESGNLVSLRSRLAKGGVGVTVADNGIGMSDEVRSNLFVRFFSTKGGAGTGLGLPVVKKIVEEHGGTLEVESEPVHGSAFHLRLPTTA
jgi:signal transduction histidine kinase